MFALLLVEDVDESAILSLVLQRCGIRVTASREMSISLTSWVERPSDMIVVALPQPSLEEQVRLVRSQTNVPLVLISDLINEQKQIDLLASGADMVVVRPYSTRLVIAQVRTLLRRTGGTMGLNLPTFSLADLTLDPANRTVQSHKRPPIRLTHLEFRLLYTLMLNRGQVLPVDKIVEWVWGYNGQGDRELVRGLVSRLRTKVEANPQKPRYIKTVPGVGYLFHAED